jgi:secondary thiamine-phosphate synthase enzyme
LLYLKFKQIAHHITNIKNRLNSRMNISTNAFEVKSRGETDIIDITDDVQKIINENNFTEGSALVFVGGSTAGITTIENEPGLMKDYPYLFEKIIPSNEVYKHDETWHDGNGFSHIRAALQGASFIAPFIQGELLLGNWQQIVLIDFDNKPRSRKIIVQITGKKNKK